MSLVRKLGVITVCDTYMCRNMAEFEVGHEVIPAIAVHLCRDCMEQIIQEAKEFFPEMKPEPEPEPEKEPEPEPVQEYYTCKYCGQQFLKPTERGKYQHHVMTCARRV